MNEKIRNRIIGGVVLVCLLIIVVPLLNAPPEEGDEAAVRTPPLPPSLQVPAAEEAVSADRRRRRIEARFNDWENFLREGGGREDARAAPQMAADACRVRVGIFAQPDTIVQSLRDEGHQVRLQDWGQNADGAELFAVYVGGTMQCGDAGGLQDALQARYGVRALIEYNNGPP